MAEDRPLLMLISDLHYEKAYHHEVWEGQALEWLAGIVRSVRPDSLIALGDMGHAWLKGDWDRLVDLTSVNAIYGNHDNLEVLSSARNKDGTRVLAEDGEIREIGGLRVGFINGIIAKKGKLRVKDGVPRQTSADFLSAAAKLTGIDILATHASPNLPEYGNRYHPSEEFEVLERIIEQISPPLSVSGHLSGPFTLSRLQGTTILRIDTSPAERHYALIDSESKQIRVMHDDELVQTGDFARRF